MARVAVGVSRPNLLTCPEKLLAGSKTGTRMRFSPMTSLPSVMVFHPTSRSFEQKKHGVRISKSTTPPGPKTKKTKRTSTHPQQMNINHSSLKLATASCLITASVLWVLFSSWLEAVRRSGEVLSGDQAIAYPHSGDARCRRPYRRTASPSSGDSDHLLREHPPNNGSL